MMRGWAPRGCVARPRPPRVSPPAAGRGGSIDPRRRSPPAGPILRATAPSSPAPPPVVHASAPSGSWPSLSPPPPGR
eukprot:130523-Pleurochrysis_carterae.AAC.1